MRKVTEQAVNAFMNNRDFKSGNTQVTNGAMYLHGNKIAEWRGDELWITNAGWSSNVTKERLNGIPGVSVQQSRWVWFLNGKGWNGTWIKVKR